LLWVNELSRLCVIVNFGIITEIMDFAVLFTGRGTNIVKGGLNPSEERECNIPQSEAQ
jgi:hypothetical protein